LLRLQALEHVRSIHSECAGYGGTTVNQGCEECSALVGGRGPLGEKARRSRSRAP
jgi:hypothetical protein